MSRYAPDGGFYRINTLADPQASLFSDRITTSFRIRTHRDQAHKVTAFSLLYAELRVSPAYRRSIATMATRPYLHRQCKGPWQPAPEEPDKTNSKQQSQDVDLYCALHKPVYGIYYHWIFVMSHRCFGTARIMPLAYGNCV
jgi:hypothetical protein